MKWDQAKFDEFIIDHHVIGFFLEPITLKSGRKSHWYVNWRDIAEDVYLLDQLTDFVLSYIDHIDLDPECFFGVPEGATKLGLLSQYKWARSKTDFREGRYILAMGRGKPKKHGELKDRKYLGVPRGNVIVIEDVTTTGGSMFSSVKDLLDADINVIAAVGLTNRNEVRDDGMSVKELFNRIGIQYYAMSNALELLPQLNPKPTMVKKLQTYFKKYGTKAIHFDI